MWNVKKIISKGDYKYALVKEHPSRTKNGYVLLHRIVVENHIGRLLNANEVVHHIDGNKFNNSIENLEVMSASEHAKLHSSSLGRLTCCFKCPNCGVLFERPKNKALNFKKKAVFCTSRCAGKFYANSKQVGLTTEMKSAISGNLVSTYRKYSTIPSKL